MLKNFTSVAAVFTLTGGTLFFAPPALSDEPGGPQRGDSAVIDVAAATMWVEPDLQREIDQPSLTNPVDLRRWTQSMDGEQKRWLTGKLESQALYGARVEVLDVVGDWSKIAVPEQDTPREDAGYPGWVPSTQLTANPAYGKMQDTRDTAVVTSPTSWLTKDPQGVHETMEISFNTELPVVKEAADAVLVSTPSGGTRWIDDDEVDVRAPGEEPAKPTADDLLATGKQFLGLPYLWAGVSGFGYDCSGFTYSVYRAHGINIPRDSTVQAEHGTPVDRDELKRGDLLLFAYEKGEGRIHHVGMYIGGERMIHTPNAPQNVEIVEVDDFDYSDEYHSARRYL